MSDIEEAMKSFTETCSDDFGIALTDEEYLSAWRRLLEIAAIVEDLKD